MGCAYNNIEPGACNRWPGALFSPVSCCYESALALSFLLGGTAQKQIYGRNARGAGKTYSSLLAQVDFHLSRVVALFLGAPCTDDGDDHILGSLRL